MTRRPRFNRAINLARDLAVEVVYLCDQDGMYANAAWSQAFSGKDMDPRDRRLAMEIAYGSIRRKKTLDWWIDQVSTRPVQQMDPLARALLRTGTYQLLFMSRVPAHAAVSESVNSARRLGHRGLASLVNAVLRKIASPEFSPEPLDPNDDPVGFLSVSQSYPEWIVQLWMGEHGLDLTRAMLEAGNQSPTVVLRTNRLKVDRRELSRMLKADGVLSEPGHYCPEALRIRGPIDGVDSLPGYHEGLFSVQDEGSMLVGHVMGIPELTGLAKLESEAMTDEEVYGRHTDSATEGRTSSGLRPLIIDTCAAPGGKATHIAELAGDGAHIVACDISSDRVSMIDEAASRLGLLSLKTVCCDARELPEVFEGKADAVLVDAPCSGLGVLARRPDARWRKNLDDIDELSALQSEILDAAALCVKPGGVLVYSTCTVASRENWEQAERFGESHPEFMPSPIAPHAPPGRTQALFSADEHMVQLLPGISDTDGFFIARFVRRM